LRYDERTVIDTADNLRNLLDVLDAMKPAGVDDRISVRGGDDLSGVDRRGVDLGDQRRIAGTFGGSNGSAQMGIGRLLSTPAGNWSC